MVFLLPDSVPIFWHVEVSRIACVVLVLQESGDIDFPSISTSSSPVFHVKA